LLDDPEGLEVRVDGPDVGVEGPDVGVDGPGVDVEGPDVGVEGLKLVELLPLDVDTPDVLDGSPVTLEVPELDPLDVGEVV
jgi:hypothetical protein